MYNQWAFGHGAIGGGGNGHYNPKHQQYQSKGKGKGKGNHQPVLPRNYDKDMRQPNKKLMMLEKSCSAMARQVVITKPAGNDNAPQRTTQKPPNDSALLPPTTPTATTTRPTMYNCKGQLVDVAWTCQCG